MAQKEKEKTATPGVPGDQVYVLNRKTEIVGYTFADGKKVTRGVRYALTPEQAQTYTKVKVDGHQVLVKE